MDEKKRILRVIEKTETTVDETVEKSITPRISYPNQTNPIYKNLAKFVNAKIGDKWSIKDLLR